ncbi:hypothetical protein CBS101457_000671 [Exobasidium rhododendri]|nr:hypothetical protein CBS101457_000671 [Exobasidium rhododendri]
MPDDFSRIDVSEREDVSYLFELIREHAIGLVKESLKKEGKGEKSRALKYCEKAVDQWIASARSSLEPNLTINGNPFSQDDAEMEPFDQALSQRVQHLTEQCDNLTAHVIEARKTLPSRRAAALQARYKLTDERQKKIDARRRTVEEDFQHAQSVPKASFDISILERAEEVKRTLGSSVNGIEKLAVTLLEQSSAADEQAKFVKRLRTMSASNP